MLLLMRTELSITGPGFIIISLSIRFRAHLKFGMVSLFQKRYYKSFIYIKQHQKKLRDYLFIRLLFILDSNTTLMSPSPNISLIKTSRKKISGILNK